MYIYNITLVPANMAVNGVFRVRGGGTGAWNLYTRKKGSAGISRDPAFSLGVPKQASLFSRLLCHTLTVDKTVYVCACVREHRKLLEVSLGGR